LTLLQPFAGVNQGCFENPMFRTTVENGGGGATGRGSPAPQVRNIRGTARHKAQKPRRGGIVGGSIFGGIKDLGVGIGHESKMAPLTALVENHHRNPGAGLAGVFQRPLRDALIFE
jgi:hypothetical protein